MRVLVFFDLPTETLENKREYRKFYKLLIKNGFLMMQESVYCRMLLTPSAGKAVLDVIRKNRPPEGIVQIMTVTEKQFAAGTDGRFRHCLVALHKYFCHVLPP